MVSYLSHNRASKWGGVGGWSKWDSDIVVVVFHSVGCPHHLISVSRQKCGLGRCTRTQGRGLAVVHQLMHQETVTLLLLLFRAGVSVSPDIGVNAGVSDEMCACSYKQCDDSDVLVIVGHKGKTK